MVRLLGAIGAMCFVLAMAGVLITDRRMLAASMMTATAVVVLLASLTSPRKAALAAAATIGTGLIVGDRPMEGAGILVLVAAAVFTWRAPKAHTEG